MASPWLRANRSGLVNGVTIAGSEPEWHQLVVRYSIYVALHPLRFLLIIGFILISISRFNLSIDADLDAPLGIELGATSGTKASVQLYVNGYQCVSRRTDRLSGPRHLLTL